MNIALTKNKLSCDVQLKPNTAFDEYALLFDEKFEWIKSINVK